MITEQGLDIFFNSRIVLTSVLWAPVFVFSASLYFMHRQHIVIKIVSPLIMAFATGLFCFAIPFSWGLRDGLGPDAIESHGQEAVSKFMTEFWDLLLICSAIFLVGLFPCIIYWAIQKLRMQEKICKNQQ